MDILSELKEQINFVELATMHGYELNARKSTKKQLFLEKGEDKILVYPNSGNNEDYRYSTCNNSNDGGTIIDFVVNKGIVGSVKQAIPYLKNLDPSSLRVTDAVVAKDSVRKPFVAVPTFPLDHDNYLVRSRAIPLEVLRGPMFGGSVMSGSRLYTNEKIKSAIFPLVYNNQVVGQNIRNVDFEHLVENTDKTNGVWKSRQVQGSAIAVFENPIDAISFYVLKEKEFNYRATVGSPSRSVVESLVQEALQCNAGLVLCGDNDKSGQHFNLNFLTRYLSFQENIDLITTFDANANRYSLILGGSNTAEQRTVFEKLSRALGPDTMKLSFSVDKIQLQTKFESPVLEKLTKLLTDSFGLKGAVAVEVSQSKDFNQDLQLKNDPRTVKKKVRIGLSL